MSLTLKWGDFILQSFNESIKKILKIKIMGMKKPTGEKNIFYHTKIHESKRMIVFSILEVLITLG